MDSKIVKYQNAIIDLLSYYADRYNQDDNLKHYVIKDKEDNHFQLIMMGFENGIFIHSCIYHFDIIDGKVWLQVNNTDNLIANELMEKGVPRTDIVIGFHEPHLREYTGFAVA